MHHQTQTTSRYDRLFALIHQAARQAHLRAQSAGDITPAPSTILKFRDTAERSLGCAPADESLRRALRP